MIKNPPFRVGFTKDFLNETGNPIFPDIGLDLFSADSTIEYDFLTEFHPQLTSDQLNSYDVIITLKPAVSAESLAGVDKLCAIGRCGVGYDTIDLAACTLADIAVYNTPAAVIRPMAESIVLLVLALSHHLVWKDRKLRKGEWMESTRKLGREPRNRVVGTVGLGGIGSDLVLLFQPFRIARFLAYDPYVDAARAAELGVELVSLTKLLELSDYVLVNCPLTPETRGLLGESELRMMKKDAVLINTARGPIVNETALIRALEDGAIRAAALDVFEQEPLDPDSRLLHLENVILTSHSIGWTEELFRDMGRIDCEGAIALAHGNIPGSVVNKEVLERPGFRRKLERYRDAAWPSAK